MEDGEGRLQQATYDKYTIWLRDLEKGDHYIAHDVICDDTYRLKYIFAFYTELLNKRATILDIGGHIGCFGIMILDFMKQARLVAFEPLPEAAEIYRNNVKKHIDAGRAFVYNNAVAYTHDSLSLISSADPAIHSGNVMAVDELQAVGSQIYSYGQSVKTITLEAAIAETGTEAELYIIKMDCECGEWDIMAQYIQRVGG